MEKRFSHYKVVKKVKSHHFNYYILVDKENKKYFAKQLFILEEKYLMNIKNEIVKLKMLKNYGICSIFNSTTRAVDRITLRKWHNQEHREDNCLPNLQLVARPQ